MSKSKTHKKEEAVVVAILTADWHLQHKPPIWRSNEPDWYEAMLRPLDEISILQKMYNCPIINAGDIFDHWNAPAELINFALHAIPNEIFAIAGQHDLPNHNVKEIHRSAFSCLIYANKIRYVSNSLLPTVLSMHVTAFSFGEKIQPCEYGGSTYKIAVVHDYVWSNVKNKYPGAPLSRKVKYASNKMIKQRYLGYDLIVYGDNHKSFSTTIGKTTIWNCGTLMRRKSDEEDYKPRVGLLYSNGIVEPYYLDTSKDAHLTKEENEQFETIEEIDMAAFGKELKKLGATAVDFTEALKQFFMSQKTQKTIQRIITKAMKK